MYLLRIVFPKTFFNNLLTATYIINAIFYLKNPQVFPREHILDNFVKMFCTSKNGVQLQPIL